MMVPAICPAKYTVCTMLLLYSWPQTRPQSLVIDGAGELGAVEFELGAQGPEYKYAVNCFFMVMQPMFISHNDTCWYAYLL